MERLAFKRGSQGGRCSQDIREGPCTCMDIHKGVGCARIYSQALPFFMCPWSPKTMCGNDNVPMESQKGTAKDGHR